MDVIRLQEVTLQKSRALGHDLSDWVPVDEGGAVAWRATCSRCRGVVYVRSEGGLLGAAGALLVEPCRPVYGADVASSVSPAS